ncbi:unnamed protein product, partial [Amoebophrya sp. A25]
VFSPASPATFLGLPGCTPVDLPIILAQFDRKSLRTIRKLIEDRQISLPEFLRIIVVKAGAYDSKRIVDFLAGLVDVFNDIVARNATTIHWRDFAELVVSTSTSSIDTGDLGAILSDGLAKVCRKSSQGEDQAQIQPQVR